MLNVLEELSSDKDPVKRRGRAILTLVGLVGAIIMARAIDDIDDSEFSNLILTTVRDQLADLSSTKNRVRRPSRRPSHDRQSKRGQMSFSPPLNSRSRNL